MCIRLASILVILGIVFSELHHFRWQFKLKYALISYRLFSGILD